MIRIAQLFPDEVIVVTLSQQLSWSHFHALLPIKDPLARDFYAEMCRVRRWDVHTLPQKIDDLLFECTALWKRPEAIVAAGIGEQRDGQMSIDLAFHDPYVLDLLGLKGVYSERDLESAILRELDYKETFSVRQPGAERGPSKLSPLFRGMHRRPLT